MPRAGDQYPGRRGGNDVYSPRRGALPFDDPLSAIGDTARQAGEGIKGVIDAALDPVLNTIYDLTGIDLHGIVDVATRFLSNIWGTNPDWLESLMSSFDGTFKWLDDLNLWLDSIGLGGGTFDPAAAAEDFIDFILNPVGKLAPMVAGLIDALHIPGLDASKIVSGLFPQSMLDITSIGAGIVTGLLSAVNIPALDASKIVSGIFGTGVIPDLDAAKIVSGFLGGGRIPNLDASKVTTGIFPQSMLSITSIAASIVTGLLSAINIPGLDASKIVSGLFGQSQVSGLTTDLNNRVTTNVFAASAQAGPNVVLGPGFEDTSIPRNNSGTTGSGYSNERTHSGTMAFKIVSSGGWDEVDLIPVPGGTFVQDPAKSIKVVPGQKWYISAWCYARSSNVGTNNAGLAALFTDSSGVNPFSYNTINGALTAVTVSTWTKISGYITVPAGYDRLLPYWFTDNPTTVGNMWHVDDAEVYQDITPANSTGIQNILDGITNYLTGLAGTLWGQTSANNALAGAKQSIEQNAAAIQAMTTTQGGGAASGKSVVVNYNDYANGALPATHTVAYFGANTSTVSILNGRAHANLVNDDTSKYWEILYNATQTNTDYQLIGITLTSLMGSGFGSQASNWVKGRVNLAQSRYVWAEFRKDDFNNIYFQLGAVTASGTIIWKGWTACPYATTAWLQCGTTGGARVYKVWVGNQVIWTHNEVGTLSDVGASNRYTGHGGQMYATAGGAVGPGDVSQFAFYDNMPPATVGSGAIITRTATGSTQANAGATQYISNGDTFFNNLERKTDDILTVDQLWGGFQVRDAGWYKLKACVKIAGAAYPDRITLRLLGASATTPDQAKYGGREHARMLSGGAVSTPPRWIADDWEVYLDANEYVYLGYDCAVLNVAGVFTGEATGLQTYFSIALINKNQN